VNNVINEERKNMLRKIFILIIAILSFGTMMVAAKDAPMPISKNRVFAENGYVYYAPDIKTKIQLTRYGKDRSPILSPDGKLVVFLRKSKKEAYLPVESREDCLKKGPDAILADQVWIVDIAGKNEKVLAKDHNPDESAIAKKFDGSTVIAHIWDDYLHFSPDSKIVYFISSAWVTSGALHSVGTDGSDERFVAASNYLKVIDKGKHKGNLIIRQHRYFLTGGSYDWYYVFSPSGKEVAVLAPELDDVDWDSLYFEGDS